MSQDLAAAPKSSGLTTLWDIIVAPRAAFAALRERPTWGWAFVATSVLGMAGAILAIPAGQHMMTAMMQQMAQTNPRMAQMTPDQLQNMLNIQLAIQRFTFLYYPILVMLGALFTGLIMLLLNAISGGDGAFKRLFALAMNISILHWGIAYFLVGLIMYLRGPDAFNTARDMAAALPSLAWLVPGASSKLAVFLASIGPFAIWSFVLLALGMQQTARIKPVWAWVGAAFIEFAGAAMGAAFVQ